MRVHAYQANGTHHLAVEQENDVARSTPYRSLAELARAIQEDALELGQGVEVETYAPSPVTLGATKMLFAGVNYRDHVDEVPGASLPKEPFFFSKLPSTLAASGDAIRIPSADIGCDYEVELAAVIGRTTRRVDATNAGRSILGFTVVNDVSARQIQFADNQITLAKNLDGFCPTANVLVSPDTTAHGDLELSSTVNGELRQCASTRDMVFSVEELISRLSSLMTLQPGDVVSTGTPAGVGWFRTPPLSLSNGDVVSVHVESIGIVRNTVEVEGS